jgi:hypothetical protein
MQNSHKDVSSLVGYLELCNYLEGIKDQTFATSSPILTNIPSLFIRVSKVVIRLCWFETVSDIVARALAASDYVPSLEPAPQHNLQ